jgi:hypothetical protein
MSLHDLITSAQSAASRALVKAERKFDAESQERAPGGDKEDDAQNAPVPDDPAELDPKTLMHDPFAIIEQLGYRDKPSSISYGTLKSIVYKVPIIGAIIQTRLQQMASFCQVAQDRYDLGFKIRTRESRKSLTTVEQKWADQMATVILRTGVTDNPRGRDSFETFMRKIMWDSLVYDQMAFEIVPNKKGQPAEWYAVDASTIRLADAATVYLDEDDNRATRYVQIYDGMIINEYNQQELAFGIRNPKTDIRLFGYGTSEAEMLINTITSILWALEYNQRAFSQGSVHKGILNFKGLFPINK